MPIQDTYREFILKQIIQDILNEGEALTLLEIQSRYNAFVLDKELSEPLFDLESAKVIPLENASATKWNTTNAEIKRDLEVAYKELFIITNQSLSQFDRWRTEIVFLEGQLKNLESRITTLVSTQTQSNIHYIIDDFVDTSKVDLTNTDCMIDLTYQTITLDTATTNSSKISLNKIKPQDVQFTVLSRKNLQFVTNASFGELKNAFIDSDSFWQSRIGSYSASQAFTAELKVKISDSPIPINKISFKSHAANTKSVIQVTPLISTDNINFSQLPIKDITLGITTQGIWSFPSEEVQWVKFLMTKNGSDFTENKYYIYEFGADQINFYSEDFDEEEEQTVISKSLFAKDLQGNPVEFNKVSLEVCERIPENTSINYYVAPLLTSDGVPDWHSINHINDTEPQYSKELSFGDIDNVIISGVSLSYSPFADLTPDNFVNPSQYYQLATLDSEELITSSGVASAQRYALINSNDRILNIELDSNLSIQNKSVEIFRNISTKHDNTLVRNTTRGWNFKEPYYMTTVEVLSKNGLTSDFGNSNIIIDGSSRNGKITISPGIHYIKVHKNNWVDIPAGATSVDDDGDAASIKSLDPLYPFNHKHLVTGYGFDSSDNIYIGVDLFAESYMSQISVNDFIYSLPKDDYSKFAVDLSAVDEAAYIDGTRMTIGPNTIFMVKSNENIADFLNEQFLLRFNISNQLYKYIKFKAVLNTIDSTIAPNLDGYKLKLTS